MSVPRPFGFADSDCGHWQWGIRSSHAGLLNPKVTFFHSSNWRGAIPQEIINLALSHDNIESIEDPVRWGFDMLKIIWRKKQAGIGAHPDEWRGMTVIADSEKRSRDRCRSRCGNAVTKKAVGVPVRLLAQAGLPLVWRNVACPLRLPGSATASSSNAASLVLVWPPWQTLTDLALSP